MTRILTNLLCVQVSDLSPQYQCQCHAGNPAPEKDLQAAIRGVGESSATAVDSDGDTANQVAEPDCNSSPEQRISGVEVALGV